MNEPANATAASATIKQSLEGHRWSCLEGFLPALFTLRGKPYDIHDMFFPFFPIYLTNRPARMTVLAGRQTSKSTNMAASQILMAATIPDFTVLTTTPLFEQVRRFSTNYVQPLLSDSPIRPLLIDSRTPQNVLQRSFLNRSKLLYTFASNSAGRARGVSSDQCIFDELQDLPESAIEIISHAMDLSPWRYWLGGGTPLSHDNTAWKCYAAGSMSEWFIPCRHCTTLGLTTWNIPSIDYHAIDMLGPWHGDINKTCPGIICHNPKCRKPLFSQDGRWQARYPDRAKNWLSIRIPQIIMPFHITGAREYSDLLSKWQGYQAIGVRKFYNEILAEAYDTGSKLVTEEDLQAAATLGFRNNTKLPVEAAMIRIKRAKLTCLGIDWGGGGIDETSLTALSLIGVTSGGRLELIWGRKLFTPNDHAREAANVIEYVRRLKPDIIAHDFTGAGSIRETVLAQKGFSLDHMIPIDYIPPSSGNLYEWVPPSRHQRRGHWHVDKGRSLQYTITCLKTGWIKTFEYDNYGDENKGMLHDFTNLVQEQRSGLFGQERYILGKARNTCDDFAQATNFACVGLWLKMKQWPEFGSLDMSKYSDFRPAPRDLDAIPDVPDHPGAAPDFSY